MFVRIKGYLEGKNELTFDKDGNPTHHHCIVSCVALLWEMASASDTIQWEEFVEIVKALNHEFDLSDAEAGELLEIAEMVTKDSKALSRFTEDINRHFTNAQKEILFAHIWKVALADGKIDPEETALASLLRKHLQMSMEEWIRSMKLASMEGGE